MYLSMYRRDLLHYLIGWQPKHIAKQHADWDSYYRPRVLSPPVFTQKMDGKTSAAEAVAGAGVSTFPHLLACSLQTVSTCVLQIQIIDTQHLGSGTILFNPLGEPNCQWNKTCNLETSTLNIPMNLSRLYFLCVDISNKFERQHKRIDFYQDLMRFERGTGQYIYFSEDGWLD